MRVLYVEDDDENREITQELLAGLGFDVTPAATAGEAIAHLEEETFDVVLADLSLPDADGWTVARVAKQSSTPVVMLTGWGEAMGSDGVDAVLRKPVPTDELGACLHEVVKR